MPKQKIISLAGFLFLLPLSTWAVGFSSGDTFSAQPITAHLHINCAQRVALKSVDFVCRDSLLLPRDDDFFVGPDNVKADHVALFVTHEDGSTKDKTVAYNSERFNSVTPFNLWIESFFQSPLLAYGKNSIKYVLSLDNKIVSSNSFVVTVKRIQTLQCPNGIINSSDFSDCEDQLTVCGRYFAENNYCH